MSEASKRSSWSCSGSVRSRHYFEFFSWNPIGPQVRKGGFDSDSPNRIKGRPRQLHHHYHPSAEPLDASHWSGVQSIGWGFSSKVQSSLFCISSNHHFRCGAVLRSKGAFTLHPAQVDPLLYSFKWNTFNGIYILLIYTNSFSPWLKNIKLLVKMSKSIKYN